MRITGAVSDAQWLLRKPLTCNTTPIRNTTNAAPIAICSGWASGPGTSGCPGGTRVENSRECRDDMEEKSERIADGRDIAANGAEQPAAFGRPGDRDHDQGDDPQNMRFAEAAVMEDEEARQAGQDRPREIYPADRVPELMAR